MPKKTEAESAETPKKTKAELARDAAAHKLHQFHGDANQAGAVVDAIVSAVKAAK